MEIRNCTVRFKDDGKEMNVKIAVGEIPFTRDDMIFFHAKTEEDFNILFNDDNGEDFVIVRDNSPYEIPFMEINQDDIDTLGGRTLKPSEFKRLTKAISDLFMENFSEYVTDAMIDTKLCGK